MCKQDRQAMWVMVGAMPLVGLVIGTLISYTVGGTPDQGFLYGFLGGLFADVIYVPMLLLFLKPDSLAAAVSSEPKATAVLQDNADLDRERAEQLKQLNEAAKDTNEPLDPLTVEAQRQEIEDTYQRKLAERKS
jgi:hypothetical protein